MSQEEGGRRQTPKSAQCPQKAQRRGTLKMALSRSAQAALQELWLFCLQSLSPLHFCYYFHRLKDKKEARDWSMKSGAGECVGGVGRRKKYLNIRRLLNLLRICCLHSSACIFKLISIQEANGKTFTSLRNFLYSVSSLNTKKSFFLCIFTTASKSETRAARFTAASAPRELSFPTRLSTESDWEYGKYSVYSQQGW